jgi:hypothetical protein
MDKKSVNLFLEQLSINSRCRILEESKDKKEIEIIAENAGIALPNPDLAIFKCVYAFVDKENKNGCTLPRKEVEKALTTLTQKPLDFDHFRKSVCGHFLKAELIKDEIIAWGVFYKSSFGEDYELVKELFDKGNLKFSFEAWGHRKFAGGSQESYDLEDIIFAGGAFLLASEPAFDGAEILEMAHKKERILEFAKVMKRPDSYLKTEEEIESAKYGAYNNDPIYTALSEVECLGCGSKGRHDILAIDYENNNCKVSCYSCGAQMSVDLVPSAVLSKKGRKIKKMTDWAPSIASTEFSDFVQKFDGSAERLENILEKSLSPVPSCGSVQRLELADEDFAIVKNIQTAKGSLKIRLLPIHDDEHLVYAHEVLCQEKGSTLLEVLSIAKDSVDKKIGGRIMTIAMKELMEKYKKQTVNEVIQEIAKVVGRELTEKELEAAFLSVTSLQTVKKGQGGASDVSLNKVAVTPANDVHAKKSDAPANSTSLQTAEVSEDELKTIVNQIIKGSGQGDSMEKDAEIASLKTQLADVTAKYEEAQTKLGVFEAEKAAAEKAARDEKIRVRKEELAE